MVLLLAALLAAGLGFPVAQANVMPVQTMGMENAVSGGSGMSMPAKCGGCNMADHITGDFGCVMPTCMSQPALAAAGSSLLLDGLRPLRLSPASLRFLTGHNSIPDPYPPRTSDIV